MQLLFISLAMSAMTPEAPFNPFTFEETKTDSRSSNYQECIELVDKTPEKGRKFAIEWAEKGGGTPASHCRAVADLATGFPKLAAIRLMAIAEAPGAGDVLVRARYLEQASRAWLQADKIAYAFDAISAALDIAPNSGELSLTAGVIYAKQSSWQSTVEAVSLAEEHGFRSVEGLVARAKAYKALSKNDLAASDVVSALYIDPFNLDALVLRGELQQLGILISANYSKPKK